jgi:uncharacterized protein YeaO (DUF488 family)
LCSREAAGFDGVIPVSGKQTHGAQGAPSGDRNAKVVIARVYDHPERSGLQRVLVDRLWPRGVRKADAPFDTWLKEVAPSTGLRTWYGHQPERFDEFADRYRRELTQSPTREAFDQLRAMMKEGGLVLVTATRDVDRSAAAVLRQVLVAR